MTVDSTQAKSTSKINMEDQGARAMQEEIVVVPPLVQADMAVLRATIARSPIMIAHRTLEARLADWQHTRQAPDIDTVILDWLVGHARGASLPALH